MVMSGIHKAWVWHSRGIKSLNRWLSCQARSWQGEVLREEALEVLLPDLNHEGAPEAVEEQGIRGLVAPDLALPLAQLGDWVKEVSVWTSEIWLPNNLRSLKLCHVLPEHPLGSEHPGRHLATHKEVWAAGLLTEVAWLGAGVEWARGHQVLNLLDLGLLTGLRVQAGRQLKPGLILHSEADLETGLTRGRQEIVVTVADSAVIPENDCLFSSCLEMFTFAQTLFLADRYIYKLCWEIDTDKMRCRS